MRNTSRLSHSLWSILLSISLLHGQAIAAQPVQQVQTQPGTDQGVLKVTTRLVQVNVVVHDKKGEPVADLTAGDFELFDKGQQQKILFFSRENNENLPTNLPPLSPGVVSNRAANFKSGGQTRLAPLPTSLTVILLDGLNTEFADQYHAKQALIKFLGQLRPTDRVAIYTLSNGLRILHDFTSDTESLLAALEKHRNQDSTALSSSSYDDADTGNEDLDKFLDQANERVANFFQTRRTETTLEALEAISRHLAGMPGRKNLIWLSSGFPTVIGQGIEAQSLSDDMRRALRTLNDVGVAIYPVDARGLIGTFATMPSMSPSTPSRTRLARGPQPVDQRAQNNIIQTHGTMFELADRTGGRAFINTNDLTGAIRRAMDDARITYTLAYSPSHEQWDGKFREIKIKMKRPGLEAKYRGGYFAYPDSPADPKRRLAVIAEAAGSPLASTGLGLLAGIAQKPTPDNPRSVIRVMMDAHEVFFARNAAGRQEAMLDFLVVAFDEKGKALNQARQTMQLNLEQAKYDQLLTTGMIMTTNADTPTNSTRIRVIVHDVGTGSVGSVDLPLK
jgi:VWFA-related protein